MFKNSLEVGLWCICTCIHYNPLSGSGSQYSSLLSIRDEETSFQNVEGKETYYVSSVTEKAECESDRGQSHPSILHLQDASSGRYDRVLQL